MITRKEYVKDSSNLFDAYYAQFITEASIEFIKNRIGLKKLKTSKDKKHLNDLYKHSNGGAGRWIWDDTPMNMSLIRTLGENNSQSTHTCVGKTIAKMMLNGTIK